MYKTQTTIFGYLQLLLMTVFSEANTGIYKMIKKCVYTHIRPLNNAGHKIDLKLLNLDT
jgi:hypothetical protein